MLTRNSMIYACTIEQAQFVAECANLVIESGKPKDPAKAYEYYHYVLWWDRQTGGGAGRICWAAGIVWISRHGGYGAAIDLTQDMAEIFSELGCKALDDSYQHKDPMSYEFYNWEIKPNNLDDLPPKP